VEAERMLRRGLHKEEDHRVLWIIHLWVIHEIPSQSAARRGDRGRGGGRGRCRGLGFGVEY
jgi:hypothetical protein